MKTDLLPTPKELNLDQVMQRFSTDGAAREYLEAIRWPKGPKCAHCLNSEVGTIWKIEENLKKKIRAGLYHCKVCDRQFTVTVGTIFEDSHIPLRKWLVAWYLICNAKKGISALQIQRALGLGSYRTAWSMMHRIRHAMTNPDFEKPLSGEVEADEMYYGPNPKKDKAGKVMNPGFRKNSSKIPVMALIHRETGQVRTKVIPNVTPKNLRSFISENIMFGKTILNTDEALVYPPSGRYAGQHNTVTHRRKQYAKHNADGTVSHVNTCESFFSLLRRGLSGSFHHVSKEHLFRYANEFSFRWNHRHVTDGERFVAGLKQTEGKRLTYKQPLAAQKPGI